MPDWLLKTFSPVCFDQKAQSKYLLVSSLFIYKMVSRAALALLGSASILIIFINFPKIKSIVKSRNGGYSKWSEWNECSETCGGGRRARIRNCSNPVPSGWGKKCSLVGAAYEIEACGQNHCPINGGPGSWQSWQACDHTCGIGTMTRTRPCDSPKPEFDGIDCSPDVVTEKISCPNLKPCPVDGKWGEFGAFSACSVSCGKGKKKRTRECNNPAPQHGGKECQEGSKEEVQDCNEKECPQPTTAAPKVDVKKDGEKKDNKTITEKKS